ncbi:hypothetical protein GOV13_05400 [Candidatus Pacearchaeota archaeon]|nr:hypothetical protein [Candidatus Pacearchaeota archaeon]
MERKIIERPGYFGTSRNEIHEKYDGEFGSGKWKIAWQWGDQIIQKPEALQIYEDGYYEFFKANKDVLNWLISTASDVYDTAPSNIEAKFSYDIQETVNNHIHDVAIRRAVLRNGVWFKGDHLVHVRPEKEGGRLGPHLIPFHLPHMIYKGEIKYKGEPRDFSTNPPWWITMGIKDSVEQFYQQNKVLQILE